MRTFSILLLLCATCSAWAQRTITGTVSDAVNADETLMGATVVAGKAATVTDLDGRFTLTVADGATAFTVTYIGYESLSVKLRPNVNNYSVKLRASNRDLDEVVVTGYQKIDRRRLTAAVSKVDINEAAVGAVNNLDQALAGQVAGLSSVTSSGAPGAPAKIRIRGTASISGTQEPLWVLDGIPLEGTDIPAIDNLNDIDDIYQTSIAGLNPSDIESLTVLKDAAATAIYGARAANGVIVITSKRGKEGRPIINFNTRVTINPRPSISRLNLMNADEKVGLELNLLGSDYAYRAHKGGVATILDAAGEYQTFKQGGWDALSPNTQQQINALRGIATDWNGQLFRTAVGQEYNASASGGSDRARYYASLGYYGEQGQTRQVDNNRYNVTLKASFKVNSRLTLGASVFANQRRQRSFLTDTGGFTNPVYYSRMANPYQLVRNADGSYAYDVNVQGRESEAPVFNIMEERAGTHKQRDDHSFMGIIDAELKIISGLKFTTQLGYQYDNYTLSRTACGDTYAVRKEKEYATFMAPDGTQQTILPDGGFSKQTEGHSNQWLWKAMLEFEHVFANIHDLQLMVGTEVRHNESNSVYSAAYGYDPRTLTTRPVLFPSETVADAVGALHQETHQENAFVSWFATGSYTLLHRYTLGASVRADGSDVFGVAKKYRYLPLYSVSGLWRASEEKPLRSLRWLSNLALRASYGLQGNIDKNTSPYLIGTIDRKSVIAGHTETVIEAETAPNPNLKWEKTANVNVGLDLALFDGRIAFSADYYYRRSTDLIGMRMLPLETGFSSTTVNWASMENRGWELALTAQPVKGKVVKWTSTLNLGFNTNKILHESVAENSTLPSREGHPVGALFAYRTAGLDSEGFPIFVADNGEQMSGEQFLKLNRHGASTLSAAEQRAQYIYMGTTDPKCAGGFINTVEAGPFQFTANLMFNLGMKVRIQPTYQPTQYDRGLNACRDILSATLISESSPRHAEYTRLNEYNTWSMLDTWVRSNSYCRLQSLRLGYRLPLSLIKRIGLSAASLSVEGRNLCVVASSYKNYLDPETMGNPYAQPIARSVIFGLNISF